MVDDADNADNADGLCPRGHSFVYEVKSGPDRRRKVGMREQSKAESCAGIERPPRALGYMIHNPFWESWLAAREEKRKILCSTTDAWGGVR